MARECILREFNYVAIITTITRQITIAVRVYVDATMETSCSPHVAIAVGGYTTAIGIISTTTADILGKQKVAIGIELGYIAIITTIITIIG